MKNNIFGGRSSSKIRTTVFGTEEAADYNRFSNFNNLKEEEKLGSSPESRANRWTSNFPASTGILNSGSEFSSPANNKNRALSRGNLFGERSASRERIPTTLNTLQKII